VAITIRHGIKENERLVQVTIGAGEEPTVVESADVRVLAKDDAGNIIQGSRLRKRDITLVHPHQTGMRDEQWRSYSLVLQKGRKLSSVTVRWMGAEQTFAISEGVLRKELGEPVAAGFQ
jgi:hypothetical protein